MPGEVPAWLDPIADPLIAGRDSRGNLSASLDRELRARMLFSCLVDADYLDTERYFTGKERVPIRFDASALGSRLSEHVLRIASGVVDTSVNAARRGVYEACLRASELPPGLG